MGFMHIVTTLYIITIYVTLTDLWKIVYTVVDNQSKPVK